MKQSHPLSLSIFHWVLEEVFRNVIWEGNGIKINEKWLNHLTFVDRIVLVLIGKIIEEVSKMMNQLHRIREDGFENKLIYQTENDNICLGKHRFRKR